jgi:hypothetical protein
LLDGRNDALDFSNSLKGISEDYAKYTQGMMEEWESMFGDMRQNLVDTYSSMDPDKYSTIWKGDIQKEMTHALQRFDEAAARSGVYTSGQKLQAIKDMQFQMADQFQKANLSADDYVRQQQTQFYGQFGEPSRQEAEQAQLGSFGQRAQIEGAGIAPLLGQQNNLASYQQGWGSNKLGQSNAMTTIGNSYLNQGSLLNGMASNIYNTGRTSANNFNTLAGAGMTYRGNMMNAYSSAAGAYGNSASGYGKTAGSLFGSGIGMLSNAANTLSNASALSLF